MRILSSPKRITAENDFSDERMRNFSLNGSEICAQSSNSHRATLPICCMCP